MDTLSAPALSISRMSSTVRRPPPTVRGMKTWSAVRETTLSMMFRPSGRGGDVVEDKLVGALGVVEGSEGHGVAGVPVVQELHTLDHAARLDVQAGG